MGDLVTMDPTPVEAVADARDPMTEEELQKLVSGEIDQAVSYIDTQIGPERDKATRYHKGEPFGDEEDGRSKVVSRDVHDVVNAILPSILRVFFGPEKVAEFAPRTSEDTAMAEQATDYVDYIIKNDNPGFLVLYSAFKDALIRNTGIVKYWFEESVEVKREQLSGLDQDAVALLMGEVGQNPDLKLDLESDPTTGLISGTITRKEKVEKFRIAAVPLEDFIICADAADMDSARFVAHRAMRTVSDLVALGFDYEWVLEQAGSGNSLSTNVEKLTRNQYASSNNTESADPAMRPVLYVEGYLLVDYDGDGIAELRRITCVGDKHEIGRNEVVSVRQLADFCPDPEPHTFFGSGPAAAVMDIQRIKSAILRNMMDSLAQSIHARLAVVEGQVNIADALNNEVGGIVRVSQIGAVAPLTTPFVGKEAFPMLDYWDQVKQDRVGISKAAAGMDPDALQSTTKAAVAATITAANQHIELIARVFAETGLKRLFRGILSLIVQHQQKERTIKLRNKWVPMCPASWRADMDVVVNVAVGSGTMEERILVLKAVVAQQEAILQTLGPQNPIVSLAQYRNAMAKIVEMAGFKDSSQFFQVIDPEAQQQAPQQQQPPQDPTAMLLAQVEMKKVEAEVAIKQAELQLKQQESLRKDDLERDRLDADIALRARELELKYGALVNTAAIKADVERDRTKARAAVDHAGNMMATAQAAQAAEQAASAAATQQGASNG